MKIVVHVVPSFDPWNNPPIDRDATPVRGKKFIELQDWAFPAPRSIPQALGFADVIKSVDVSPSKALVGGSPKSEKVPKTVPVKSVGPVAMTAGGLHSGERDWVSGESI